MARHKLTNPIPLPADVPEHMHATYQRNYDLITKKSGRLFLFACDQKIEHMHDDFTQEKAHPDAADPEHLFRIAQQGRIGALATHLGLVARYGHEYPTIPYIIKLNAKTNLHDKAEHDFLQDPFSAQLYTVEDVITFQRESHLTIAGVGLTVYLGSDQEALMLEQAAHTIFTAHQHGLITILWMYPRGHAITDDQDPHLLAGAAGVANALGADFVKIKPPHATAEKTSAQHVHDIVMAAGNTHVICSGGKKEAPQLFLAHLYDQLHIGKTQGCATGRNIFQCSLSEAIALTRAIGALVFDNASLEDALVFIQKLS